MRSSDDVIAFQGSGPGSADANGDPSTPVSNTDAFRQAARASAQAAQNKLNKMKSVWRRLSSSSNSTQSGLMLKGESKSGNSSLSRICSKTLMDKSGDDGTQQRPLGAVDCCPLFLLTCALLMTSSQSKAPIKKQFLLETGRLPKCTTQVQHHHHYHRPRTTNSSQKTHQPC